MKNAFVTYCRGKETGSESPELSLVLTSYERDGTVHWNSDNHRRT